MNKIIKFGSHASVACMIHCLACPLLIAILPAVGLSFFLSEWSEIVMMAVAIFCSTIDLCWGFKKHHNLYPVTLFIAGVLWYKVGHLSNHSVLFVIIGALCFLCSNLLNRKLCKKCRGCTVI